MKRASGGNGQNAKSSLALQVISANAIGKDWAQRASRLAGNGCEDGARNNTRALPSHLSPLNASPDFMPLKYCFCLPGSFSVI